MATMDGQTVSRSSAPLEVPGVESEVLADRAEEVRAWLVQVRGGAPFLSGADAAVLSSWLGGGVAVTRILGAIEAAAAHRRAKRLRGPFTLKGCARWIEDPAARGTPGRAGGGPARSGRGRGGRLPGEGGPASPLVPEPPALPSRLLVLATTTEMEIAALQGADPEDRARLRCARARAFFALAWDALEDRRASLVAEAAAELEDLREVLAADDFDRVCEEAARHRVRGWFPLFSVEAICEAAGAVGEVSAELG